MTVKLVLGGGPELIADEWDRDPCQHIYLPTWDGGVIRHCRFESKYYYKGGKFCGHHTPGVGSRKREPVTYRRTGEIVGGAGGAAAAGVGGRAAGVVR